MRSCATKPFSRSGPEAIQVSFLDTNDYVFPDPIRAQVESVLSDIEPRVRELLPMLASRLNVTVYPGLRVIPEAGSTGFTPTKDWIQVTLNPWDERGLESVIATRMPALFAHEAHHAARYVAAGVRVFDDRIISTAVFEGLATVFEGEVTGLVPRGVSTTPTS